MTARAHGNSDFTHQLLAVFDALFVDARLEAFKVLPGRFAQNAFAGVGVIFMAVVTTVSEIM